VSLAARVDVDISGAVRQLDALIRSVADVRPAARAVAVHAVVVARSKVPRRTGRLSGSIRADVGRNYSAVRAGNRSVPYAGVIERGWRRHGIEPDSYLAETGDVMALRAPTVYAQHIRRIIHERGLN
jgi:hypothetical protein